MKRMLAYLAFAGNCREAMTFYKGCLGGDLVMQTVGETPMASQMPPATHKNIMHAALTNGAVGLMASDMMEPGKIVQGNTFSLMIDCSSEEEIKSLFPKLSAGGKVHHPLKEEFWGSTFGDFTDKFGVRWMMNWDKPKT